MVLLFQFYVSVNLYKYLIQHSSGQVYFNVASVETVDGGGDGGVKNKGSYRY